MPGLFRLRRCNPHKIAIAVLLENGGWGATAAPLARQLSDYYLLKLKGGQNTTVNKATLSGAQTIDNPLLAASEPAAPARRSIPPFQTAYDAVHRPASDILPASGATP